MVSSSVSIFNIRRKERKTQINMSNMRSSKKTGHAPTQKYAGTDFDGQEQSLKGFVFQLASERKKDSPSDQFKETKEAISIYCSTNLKKTPENVQSILRKE